MDQFTQTNQLLETSNFFYTIAIGLDGLYAHVSPNYDRNFNFIGGSLMGREFSVTLHPEDIILCADGAQKCFENPDKLIPVTLRKHNGKGDYVFTQWEMRAMLNAEGNPEGIFCIGYNITAFIQAKTEIEIRNNRLDEIGLLQSHSFRKPLANIMGLSTILESMEVDSSHQHINKLIHESALELDQAIKKISNIAAERC